MSRHRKVVGDSLTLATRQGFALALTTAQTLVAAKTLGPAGFGTFAIVSVLAMMAAVCTLGYVPAAQRELPHYRATGESDRERITRNHVFCGEVAIAALWTVVILGIAAFQREPELRAYLAIVAIGVVPAKLLGLYQLEAYVTKDFNVLSRALLLVTAATALLIVALAWRFRVYAVLGAPIAGALAGLVYYRRHYRLGMHWGALARPEFARLARIGVPMAALGVVSGHNGVQRWIERGLIGAFLGAAALGIYAFFGWITLALYTVLGTVIQALQPHLLELMSRDLDHDEIARYVIAPIWTVAAASFLAVGASIVVLPDLIAAILPAYTGGTHVLVVLLVAVAVACLYWIPGVMLSAVRIDAQVYYLGAWCAAIVVSTAVALALLEGGAGVISMAYAYLLSQLLMLALTYRRVWHYLFQTRSAAARLARELALPLVNVVVAVLAIEALSAELSFPQDAVTLFAAAAVKGVVFTLAAAPTLVVLEKKTGAYTRHVRPLFSKAA